MVWGRFDDKFADHTKVDALSDGAFRLHVSAVLYAAGQLTDGFVPADRVPRLVPRFKRSYIAELVAAGIWHGDGRWCDSCAKKDSHGVAGAPAEADGIYLHDFLGYHPTKAYKDAERQAAADRQRKHRESRRDKQRDEQRESRPPRPDPARPEGSRAGVSEEPTAYGPPAPAAEGGAGSVDTSLPPEIVERNVEGARAARDVLHRPSKAPEPIEAP